MVSGFHGMAYLPVKSVSFFLGGYPLLFQHIGGEQSNGLLRPQETSGRLRFAKQ